MKFTLYLRINVLLIANLLFHMQQALFVIFLVFFLQSCKYDNAEDLYPMDANSCETESLVYDGQMDAIFNENCATSGCHVDRQQSPDLSTYDGVNANLERIRIRAVVEETMPKSGALSICDQDKINQWIADGAPES